MEVAMTYFDDSPYIRTWQLVDQNHVIEQQKKTQSESCDSVDQHRKKNLSESCGGVVVEALMCHTDEK